MFGSHFKVWKGLLSKHFEDFWNLRNMDLLRWAALLGDFLFPSRRTAGKVEILLGDECTIHQYTMCTIYNPSPVWNSVSGIQFNLIWELFCWYFSNPPMYIVHVHKSALAEFYWWNSVCGRNPLGECNNFTKAFNTQGRYVHSQNEQSLLYKSWGLTVQ